MLGIGRWGPLGRMEVEAGVGAAIVPGVAGVAGREPGPAGMEPGPGGEARAGDPAGPERDAWVVLVGVEGVGPVSFARLMGAFGSARAVLDATADRGALQMLVAATAGPDGGSPTLTPQAAAAVRLAAAAPERHLEPVRRSGVTVLTLADETYPSRLRMIDLPPPVLFLHGDPAALDRPRSIAIVGTRRPTETGRATAGRISDGVAALGATVVSGLALGIDGAAHAAAVRAGTPTVAVIGGGHERLYPAAHRALARSIADHGGAVLSEFAPDTRPSRGTFPRRNRIISGLADATVVVEAGARSGALTTAAWALEQGRALYLVPGRLDDPAVAGCLAFLREAGPEARIVAGIPELLEDLGLLAPGGRRHPPGDALLGALSGAEQAVATHVAAGLASVDELVQATGSASATVLGALTSLEIRGLVVEAFGRYRATGPLAGWGAGGRSEVARLTGRRRPRAA